MKLRFICLLASALFIASPIAFAEEAAKETPEGAKAEGGKAEGGKAESGKETPASGSSMNSGERLSTTSNPKDKPQ